MAEENENKRSFLEKLGDAGGGILNVAGRVGEGVVDGLAESRPLIGRPLQYGLNAAGFNTEGYQDRQDQRAKRKEELLAARNRNQEWDANVPVREEERKAKLELLDARRKDQHVAQFSDLLDKELAGNPQFQNMSFPERQAYLNSPGVKAMMEAKYYTGEIMGIAKNDKEAFGRMDRALRKKGWSLVDGEDGIKYLDMGNLGRIPATKESIDNINRMAAKGALEELNARANLSTAACLGDPGKSAISKFVKAVMPYNRDSAADSTRMIKAVYDGASEQEKGYHLFNHAFIDYRNPNLPLDARLAGLARCQPFLQKMGFAVEGLDPKNPDIDKLTFIDMRGKEPVRLTTQQFEALLKQNDTLGMRLENRVAQVRDSYRQQAGIQLRNEMREAAAALKPAKTAKGEAAGKSGTAENPVPTGEKIGKLAASYGDDVHTWNEDNIKKLAAMDKRINQYAISVGAIVKNDQGQYVLSGNTDAVRKVSEQFDKFTKASGIKNVGNPWEKYVGQSVDTDKKSLRDSTVPMARKNVERLYERHKEQLAKWGIGDLDTAIRYAEELPDYGVGLGAASDPDRGKKQKIIGDLRKAVRGWRRYSKLAK